MENNMNIIIDKNMSEEDSKLADLIDMKIQVTKVNEEELIRFPKAFVKDLRKHHEEALKLREMFIDGKIEQC
jgi:hypothetical protein